MLQCVAVCCSVLQCGAVCCSVLQCGAVCCSVLQCVAVCCSVLQCVAVCCSVLQCAAVCCNVLKRVAVCCHALQCVAGCCRVLQGVAARYSVMLQCVAICCSVLQCNAVCRNALQCDSACLGFTLHYIVALHYIVSQLGCTALQRRAHRKHSALHCVAVYRSVLQRAAAYCTGWRGPIGCLKIKVIFHKRTTNNRAVLREMTYKNKASYSELHLQYYSSFF